MNRTVNAGVQANVGMEFQKHCVLFILLDDYAKYSSSNYFIILEHHEDVVIGFNNISGILEHVDAYQAKKSSNKWAISGLIEIIYKLTESALNIISDPIPKTNTFSLNEYFITNNNIELKVKEKGIIYNALINETNEIIEYPNLDNQIKSKIQKKLIDNHAATPQHIAQLDNLSFGFIDLPRKSKSQEEQLIGKIKTEFGDRIEYHEAAFKTIMRFLGKSDKEYNQGNKALLSEQKKRIESSEIAEVFNIICTKVKAYKLWRSKQDQIAIALSISIIDKIDFQFHFENSFDRFKDLKEVEHRKVIDFVRSERPNFSSFTTEEECLQYLNNKIHKKISSMLLPLQLKATLYAAFIETTVS